MHRHRLDKHDLGELEDWHMPDDTQPPPLLDVAACIGLWALGTVGIVLEVLGQ